MEEARYNEIRAIRDRMALGMDIQRAINHYANIDSGVSSEETLNFLHQQTAYDEDWKMTKAFANGVKGSYKGMINFLQMLRDENIRQHQEQDANYVVNQEAVDVLDNAADVKMYDIKGKSKLEQFGIDLAQGAGQLATQALAGIVSGGVGATAFMGANIAGSQYADLIAQGVDSRRAMRASFINAALQAPLEYIGFNKIFKAVPANALWKAKAREVFERAVTESVTEQLQKFPEQFTNIYAQNEGIGAQGIAREWDKNAAENLKEMGYEGMLAFLLGGSAGGLHIAVSTRYQKEMRAEVHKTQQEETEKRIEKIRTSGINPQYAAIAINNNLNDYVYVDGEALNGYAQQHNIQKVAEGLGVSVETIEKAAKEHDTVEIKQGNFEAYSAMDNAFYQTVKDDVAFDTDGYTTNNAKISNNAKIVPELSKPAQEAFDAEIKKIRTSAEQALVPKTIINREMDILISGAMALNPENPVEIFQTLMPVITNNGISFKGNREVYYSKKHKKYVSVDIVAREKLQQVEKDFASNIDRWASDTKNFDKKDSGKLFKLMDMPLIMQLIGIPKMELMYYGSFFKHAIRAEHPGMDTNVLKQIPKALTDPIAIFRDSSDPNSFVSMLEVTDNNGATVVVVVEINKKDNMRGVVNIVKTAYGRVSDNKEATPNYYWFKKQFDNKNAVYINKKKSNRWLQAIKGDSNVGLALFNNALNESVYDETDFVKLKEQNKGYYQNAYHGTPHTFNEFSLDYVSTGEGGAAHGYGLYFSKDKDTAEYYKKTLANEHSIVDVDGKTYYSAEIPGTWDVVWIGPNGERYAEGTPEDLILTAISEGYRGEEVIDELGGNEQAIALFRNEFKNAKISKELGNVYTAEVPEDNELIDEMAPLSDQVLKDKIIEVLDANGVEYSEDDYGLDLYEKLADVLGSNKLASETLRENGIKGILFTEKYEGENVVVFDAKDVRMVNEFEQENQSVRKGSINFQDNQAIINLFKQADASTVIHETGHYFLELLSELNKQGKLDEKRKADFIALLEYGGMTLEQWDNADTNGRRKCHERIAEAFETYIMEGKAPSKKLRRAFEHFAKWLKAVYKSIARSENAVELTDEVRNVFDRMLASEEEIAEEQRINNYFAKLPTVITDNISDKQKNYVLGLIDRAREKAEVLFVRESMKNFSAERKEAIKTLVNKLTPEIENQLKQNPLYAASLDIEEDLGKTNTARVYARKYLNSDGKIYTDWKAELTAVEAEIADRLNPIIERLKEGMGNGVAIAGVDEYGNFVDPMIDTPHRYIRISNNAQWYQDFYAEHGYAPNNKEIEEIAYEVYIGKNNALPEYFVNNGDNEADFEQAKAELDELLARKDDLLEMKEAVVEYKHLGLTPEQRQLFEAYAENNGFASGADFAEQALNAPTFRQAVQMQVADIVANEYPDVKTDRALRVQAIKESLYNNDSALLIAVERQLIYEGLLKQIAKDNQKANTKAEQQSNAKAEQMTKEEMFNQARAFRQQAMVNAEADVLAMPLKEACKTNKFITAERNCAIKAAQAIKDKDFNRAIGYKNQQAYYHACVQVSKNVRKRREQFAKYIKRQVKSKRESWYNEDYFNQAATLLHRMGLNHKQFDTATEVKSLNDFIREKAIIHGHNIVIPEWIANNEVDIANANALTVSQYEDVANTLKNIKTLANAEKGQDVLNRNEDRSAVKSSLMNALSILPKKWENNINKKIKGTWRGKFLRGLINTDTFFEAMDNYKANGFFSKLFYEPVKIANDKLADYTMQFESAYREAWKKRFKNANDEKNFAEEVSYVELGEGSKPISKHGLIKMLIYLTTKSSSDKLCATSQGSTYAENFSNSSLWVEGDLETTRNNLLEFIGSKFTKEDLEFAQSLVDSCGMFWEERAELDRETTGFKPRKEQAYPASLVLADGTVTYFIGGYFPLVRDQEAGSRPFGQDAISALNTEAQQQGSLPAALHTNRGASISRDKSVYAINLRTNAEVGAVMDSIHDICMRKVVSDFRWLVNDREIYKELKTRMGVESFEAFQEYVKSVAQPYGNGGYLSLYEKDAGSFLSALRRKTVYFMIMGKLSTLTQNFGNIWLYGNTVEGWSHVDTFAALGNWTKRYSDGKGYKALKNEVISKSVFMRERMEIPDITLREMKVEEGKRNPIERFAVEWGTTMLVTTDNLTALPVWWGAYNKKLNAGASEQEAVDFADSLIRKTIGSGRSIDVAPMQRGGELIRLLTVFQQFFNTQFNQWYRTIGRTARLINEGNYTEAAFLMTTHVAAKWFMACLMNLLLVGNLPFEDDDEDGYANLVRELVTYPTTMFGPLGQAGSVVLQSAMGMRNYGYRLTPVQSSVDQVIKVGKLVNKVATGEKGYGDLVEPTANLVGLGIGVPQQMFTLFFNAYDAIFNDMDLQGSDIFRRRPVKER